MSPASKFGRALRCMAEVESDAVLALFASDGGGTTLCVAGPVSARGGQLFSPDIDFEHEVHFSASGTRRVGGRRRLGRPVGAGFL